jgi:hypothetical protein
MKTMPALAVLLLVTAAALAEERTVSIQDAPGHNAVEVNCGRTNASSCAATLRPSDDPRPDDAIRDAQRGGAGRGGAAQHVAGNGADARD